MLTEGTVVLTVIKGKNSVAVEAEMLLGDTIYSASGTSKCDPVDQFDDLVGYQLAVGRAIRQLGREVYRTGNEAVKKNDRVRAKQAEEAEKVFKVKQAKAKAKRKEFLSSQSPKPAGSKAVAKLSVKR